MNNRERLNAVLNYEPYDRLPIVHFGFWEETVEKWYAEGHLTPRLSKNVRDSSRTEGIITRLLGFDFNYSCCFGGRTGLMPGFRKKKIETYPDGSQKVMDADGAIVLIKPGVVSIPAEIDHTLKDRASWEGHFIPRLQYDEKRIDLKKLEQLRAKSEERDMPLGLHCGSLMGVIRNWMGIVGLSYCYADDEELFDEIIDTVAGLCYRVTERILQAGVQFDFVHFWEDICFNKGPLVNPSVFKEKVGPHYKHITGLCARHGIKIISLDCDGCIDTLIPTWIENGVNTMFPIEVGTWSASIKPWRGKYGQTLRGVGGMDKRVFAYDYRAIDQEIERLRPLVELGGYIPCPDHRIPPDAKWENVQYYCEKMKEVFWN